MTKILITILILLESLEMSLASDIYISNDSRNFSDARGFCESRNQTLLVAPTYDEYSMFEKQFGEKLLIFNKFWIGVHKPVGETEYKWINDKQLNVYWKHDAMHHLVENRCVVARKEDALWKTMQCDSTEANIICVDYAVSATTYTIHTDEVNYTDARNYCNKIGQDLVMIKNKQQHEALRDFLANNPPSKDVWIGLRNFGLDDRDYWKFKWIDGETLNVVDGKLDLNKTEDHYKCMVYKEDGSWAAKECKESNHFICTGLFTIKVRDELTNYYDLIENKKPYIDPLETYKFSSKSKCAAECSKSVNCYMYTYDGHNCKLFKKSTIYINNDVQELKLYQRRVLN